MIERYDTFLNVTNWSSFSQDIFNKAYLASVMLDIGSVCVSGLERKKSICEKVITNVT